MKKFLLTLLGMATAVSYANADALYHTTFDSAEEIQGWTVIDSNQDGSTWGYSESNDSGKRFYYLYSSTNKANDWAISPAITPTESGKILVTYNFTGSAYSEAMEVYYGDKATIEGVSQHKVGDFQDIDSEMHGSYFIIDAEAGKPFYIGFYACSQPDRWRLYLNSLTVSTIDGDPSDLALEAITAPVTGENLGKEAVTVLIKNVGNSEVSKFEVAYAIDGENRVTEEVEHTLAVDDEFEYTFKTLADISETRKEYTISAEVIADGDIEASNNAATIKIRNYGDAVEPYTMGFESSEDTSRVKFFNLNEDSGDWEIAVGSWYMNLARTGNNCIAYNYDKDNAGDDWAILEPIKVKAGYHALKFWYSGGDNHTEKLRVAYGTSADPEAMTNTIIDLPEITQGDYQEAVAIFSVDQDETIYIGFHAYSDKDENWLSVDDISLDSFDATEVDMSISNFNSIADYVPQADYKRITFDLYNMSLNKANAEVKVYVDDALIHTATEEVLAQQSKTFTYEGLLDNVAEGTHTIKVTVYNENDTKSDNNEVSRTVRFLGTPDILYDFEDGNVPEDFQYFVHDDGTLNASAVSEYGENGWTTFEVENHKLYGNYMLAGSTWVDLNEDEQIDRILVLPMVKVTSDDACFVWNAGAFNDNYPVNYRVMAYDGVWDYEGWGTNLDNKYYYDFLKTVNNQGTERSNQGVSLTDYKDKTIYVAFHLFGAPGDAIILDNLQFHGCSLDANSVANIANDATFNVKFNGEQLYILGANAIKSVRVYDVNGRVVAAGNTASLSLSALPKGVYIVRAASVDAVKTVKIVK
jgi:hypothetical protein